jgi:diacylglycerol O-acyltransferase / wax synthase
MRQLSGLDAGFLYIETEQTPMHVGSLSVYAAPEASDFADILRAHIQKRLHLAPILTQRLALMPFDLGHPVWVDAGELDYGYHFQVHTLSKRKSGASDAELHQAVADLHAAVLDRDKPLWQFHLLQGLSGGRFGFYAKVHHAALDGAAGVLLANALLDLSPQPREVEANASKPARTPSATKMIGQLFSNTFAQYAKLARTLPSAVKRVADVALEKGVSGTLQATRELGKELLAPKTPFNVSIDRARSFATLSISLAEVKAIAAACDATINDVVTAMCAGALRSYLQAHKQLPNRDVIAAIPISLRDQSDARMNNQVTMLPCALATLEKTAQARLLAAKAAMGEIKGTTSRFKDLIPTDYPSLGAPWLISGVAQLFGKTKIANHISMPVNLVISNVPGPKVPLYLAGAKMLAYYPVSIVIHGLALNITVHSYAGQLDFGLISCAKAVPDLSKLCEALEREHEALKAVAAEKLLGPLAKSASKAKPKTAVKTAAKAGAKPAGKIASKAVAKASAKTATKRSKRKE